MSPQARPDPEFVTVHTKRGPIHLAAASITDVTDCMLDPDHGFQPRAVVHYTLAAHKGGQEVLQLLVSDVASNVRAEVKRLTEGSVAGELWVPPSEPADEPVDPTE